MKHLYVPLRLLIVISAAIAVVLPGCSSNNGSNGAAELLKPSDQVDSKSGASGAPSSNPSTQLSAGSGAGFANNKWRWAELSSSSTDPFQIKFTDSNGLKWGQYIGEFTNGCPNSQAEAACKAMNAELPDHWDFQDLIGSFDHGSREGHLFLTVVGQGQIQHKFGDFNHGTNGYFWAKSACSSGHMAAALSPLGSGYEWAFPDSNVLAVRCVRRPPVPQLPGGNGNVFVVKYSSPKNKLDWSQTLGVFSNGCVHGYCETVGSDAEKACEAIGGQLPSAFDYGKLLIEFGGKEAYESSGHAYVWIEGSGYSRLHSAFGDDWKNEHYWTSTGAQGPTVAIIFEGNTINYGLRTIAGRPAKYFVRCVRAIN